MPIRRGQRAGSSAGFGGRAPDPVVATGVTTGVTGTDWRATVTEWGAVVPWNGDEALDWFVAADDRWHVPSREPTVRQRQLDGSPVVETRLRVPGGDVVEHVYSVADHGGLTIIAVTNESTMPVAVAFSHRRLLTERPVVDMPIAGIELATGACSFPIGHRAGIRVALAHDSVVAAALGGVLPAALPSPEQVRSGWRAFAERPSRFVLPDDDGWNAAVERLAAARCRLALEPLPDVDRQPAELLLALDTMAALGEPIGDHLDDLASAVSALAGADGWHAQVALEAAQRALAGTAEARAERDLAAIMERRSRTLAQVDVPDSAPPDLFAGAWLEGHVAAEGALLPAGFPGAWLGQPIEAHGVPTMLVPGERGVSRVSLAIRWHGERPAVLWEQHGPPVTLTAPTVAPEWHSADARGEALWPSQR